MRILITGFLLLVIWTILSTYLYLNKVRNSIAESADLQADTIVSPPQVPKVLAPDKLLIYYESDKWNFITGINPDTLFSGFHMFIDQNPESVISITGHADASGSSSHNLELGNKRALTIRDYFISIGVPTEKIIVMSKGEEEPIADNNTPEGKAKNRRSEITIK